MARIKHQASAQESLWGLNQDGKERSCGANHSKNAPTAVCGVDQTSSLAPPIGNVKEENHGEGRDPFFKRKSTIEEPLEHHTSDRVETEHAAASSTANLRQASKKFEAFQGKSETEEERRNVEAIIDPLFDNSDRAFVDNIASRDATIITQQAKYTIATGYHEVEHNLRGGVDKETLSMYGNVTTPSPSGLPPLEANSTEKRRYGNSEGLSGELEALNSGENEGLRENFCSEIPGMPWGRVF